MINLTFRKYDFVDVWYWKFREVDYSLRFYSPSFKHSFCWWDKFNEYYGGEKITYFCFLWMKVEIVEKIQKRPNLLYLDLVINRLTSEQKKKLAVKLLDSRYWELADILETSHRLELEGISLGGSTRIDIDLARMEITHLDNLLRFYE